MFDSLLISHGHGLHPMIISDALCGLWTQSEEGGKGGKVGILSSLSLGERTGT